jgi:hypothetical protein
MLRLVSILSSAFNNHNMEDAFLKSMSGPLKNNGVVTLCGNGLLALNDCLHQGLLVSEQLDILEGDARADCGNDPSSSVQAFPAKKKLDLSLEEEKTETVKPQNVADYVTNAQGLRVSILALSLFVNMGNYVADDATSREPACFFSQPSFNSRKLSVEDVNKHAKGLYDMNCIYEHTDELAIVPYVVTEHNDNGSENRVNNIGSVALAGKTKLVSHRTQVATWIDCSQVTDDLYKFFMEADFEKSHPKFLPDGMDEDSFDAYNFRFSIFMEQFFTKFNRLSTKADWLRLCTFMETKLKLTEAFRDFPSNSFQWIWHRCHIMMCGMTRVRVATAEGNHRMESLFLAMFNLVLQGTVSELLVNPNKRSVTFTETELKDSSNKFIVSRVCVPATIKVCWPSVCKKETENKSTFGYEEKRIIQIYSALQQNKKEGSVSRDMGNVITSYLGRIKDATDTKKKYNDDRDMHRPGSLRCMLWSIEGIASDERAHLFHKPAPNDALLLADAAAEDNKNVDATKQKKIKTGASSKPKASNKHLNDDGSTGCDARAMVCFREHILQNILSDDSIAIKEIVNGLLEVWAVDASGKDAGLNPKNENQPRKLVRSATTSSVLAKHIGYQWTIERSIHGCFVASNLTVQTLRPPIWPVVLLVSNFVHDDASLSVMIQVLENNGKPFNEVSPINVSKIVDYPKIFNPGMKSYCHTIVHAFLKPQMMLYESFLKLFQKQYSDPGEVNIRNRHMLSIGKSWLNVVNKFGLWIDGKVILLIHSKLKICLEKDITTKGVSKGTNLPQLAAHVCSLINFGVFEWSNTHTSANWNKRTGAYDLPGKHPPSDYDCYVPIFKFGAVHVDHDSNLASFRLKIEDIVELVILGTCNEKQIPSLNKVSLWSIWTEDFTPEHCKSYVDGNKRPDDKEPDSVGSAEKVLHPMRDAKAFRKKLYANNEHKKHLNQGDDGKTYKAADKCLEAMVSYKSRLDEMSIAMMEGAMFLRHQKELLTFHMNDSDMKEKNGWSATSVLSVLQKQGGENCRPFSHPDAAVTWLAGDLEDEMKLLAGMTYKLAKKAQKAEKPDAKVAEVAKTICVEATERAFNFPDGFYDAIVKRIVEKRKAALAEKRNEKKRKKLQKDAERKSKKKPKIEHEVDETHVDSDDSDDEDVDDDKTLAEAIEERKQEHLLKDAKRKSEKKQKSEHGVRVPNIDSDESDDSDDDDDDENNGLVKEAVEEEEKDEEEDP